MLDQGAPPQHENQSAPPSGGVGARLMRRKPVERLVAEGGQGEGGSLRRSLGLWQLTMISIGGEVPRRIVVSTRFLSLCGAGGVDPMDFATIVPVSRRGACRRTT